MTMFSDFIQAMKFAAPKMLLFFKAVFVYFLMDGHNHSDEYWSTILKCGPIFGLILFILLCDINAADLGYEAHILNGLLCSCVGDALLNHKFFLLGMAAFAMAQSSYVTAFGFVPLVPEIGFPMYLAGVASVLYLSRFVEPAIFLGLPLYVGCLLTMCWRALALLYTNNNHKNVLRIICAICSIIFVISDGLIAIDKFVTPINNGGFWIMSTYYVAQFGITLSILTCERLKSTWMRSEEKPILDNKTG